MQPVTGRYGQTINGNYAETSLEHHAGNDRSLVLHVTFYPDIFIKFQILKVK